MQQIAEFWAQWGHLAYVGAAIWAFLEGETFVLFAAALGAAYDLVNPWILIGSVWFGSYTGDQLWFFLGKRYGRGAIKRIPGGEAHLGRAERLVHRYGDAFVLSFRFIYGVRNVASAACGMAGMSHARFAVLNFIAAGLWATTFVAVGWYLVLLVGEDRIHWVLLGIMAAIIAFFSYRIWRGRRSDAAAPPVAPKSGEPTPPAG